MDKQGTQQRTITSLNELESRNHIKTFVLLAATAFAVYLCYLLVEPFLPAIIWALALSVLFTPLQQWLELKVKKNNVAALISALIIGLTVVAPVAFVGQRLFLQAAQGAKLIEMKVKTGEWRHTLEAYPRLTPIADRIEQEIDLPGTVTTFANWLSITARSVVMGSMYQLLGFVMTFYILFYFLRDRSAALKALRALSPLSHAAMDRMFSRVRDTIFATVYGTLLVASLQGLLGGLMFWCLGLSAPLLWGVIMALLAVVPVLGAFVVWIPASIFLGLEGSWGKALILALWGMAAVGTVDNFIRPVLVGRRLKLHTILAFMSIVGGLLLFGSAGLILGPVVLTATTVLLENWPGRKQAEAVGNDNSDA